MLRIADATIDEPLLIPAAIEFIALVPAYLNFEGSRDLVAIDAKSIDFSELTADLRLSIPVVSTGCIELSVELITLILLTVASIFMKSIALMLEPKSLSDVPTSLRLDSLPTPLRSTDRAPLTLVTMALTRSDFE